MSLDPRSAYVEASVATAAPDRLLVMLVLRLQLDVRRAVDAQLAGDHASAHGQLLHAQDIVLELRSTLDVDAFAGGPALGSLYDWLTMRLVRANVERDVSITQACLPLVDELAATWTEAATAHASAPA